MKKGANSLSNFKDIFHFESFLVAVMKYKTIIESICTQCVEITTGIKKKIIQSFMFHLEVARPQ